jgi:NADPH-dependent glutamate synthase beta subunit-like oxidoreductase
VISQNAIPLRFQTAEVGVDWLQCNIECQEGCPVNTNCRGYLMLAAEGRFEEGYILARDPNPVAAICGYVCSAPCEKACRRGDIDKPLSIRAMKRFLVDWHYSNNMPDDVQVRPPSGQSVGVIGAGPAGLSVAKELATYGHEVHVYEALPSGGGTTLIGVPAFRLPRDVIELDVNWVAKHGVQFHYNVEVGRDITMDQLKERHDAVVVSAGCMYPVAMNVPGEELEGVIYGVDFLKRANLGQEQWVGHNVVVVGGGYTAMDSSRTALRLGAKTSVIAYRRGPDEMVVDEEEQHETRFEGVEFEFFASPVEVLSDGNGKVAGMVFQRVRLGMPDATGRRSPEPIPGSEFTIPCDMVIPCTSQAADNNILGEYGAELNRNFGVVDPRKVLPGGSLSSWRTPPLNGSTPVGPNGEKLNQLQFDLKRGYVATNRDTFETSVEGIFACGDFVSGPATIIEAAGRGRGPARAGVRGGGRRPHPAARRGPLAGRRARHRPRGAAGHQSGEHHPDARARHAAELRGHRAPAHPHGAPGASARLHQPRRGRLRQSIGGCGGKPMPAVQSQHQHRRPTLYPVRTLRRRLPRGRHLHDRQGAGRRRRPGDRSFPVVAARDRHDHRRGAVHSLQPLRRAMPGQLHHHGSPRARAIHA